MSVTVYVPKDSAALSVGADKVARAIAEQAEARKLAVRIKRNGSRGLLWLEPLIEVETPAGRIAYGPVEAADVASLFEANFLQGGQHALSHGPTEQIPYFKNQQRLTFRACGADRAGKHRRVHRTRGLCAA